MRYIRTLGAVTILACWIGMIGCANMQQLADSLTAKGYKGEELPQGEIAIVQFVQNTPSSYPCMGILKVDGKNVKEIPGNEGFNVYSPELGLERVCSGVKLVPGQHVITVWAWSTAEKDRQIYYGFYSTTTHITKSTTTTSPIDLSFNVEAGHTYRIYVTDANKESWEFKVVDVTVENERKIVFQKEFRSTNKGGQNEDE